MTTTLPAARIDQQIHVIRGHKVMLDVDLAELYEVETRILIRNVKRHRERFPTHFMFQLTREESEALRSQFGISKKGVGDGVTCPIIQATVLLRHDARK